MAANKKEIDDFMAGLVKQPLGPANPFAEWRWFVDLAADRVVMEPRLGTIKEREIRFLDMYQQTYDIEAVFRHTPNMGVYLVFRLRSVDEL